MKPNADLTHYAKGVDPVTRTETYTRHEIRDVVWEESKAVNVIKSGVIDADRVTVYIPFASGPVSIKKDDVIVRDIVPDEISPAFTITALKAKYPASGTVRSMDKYDRGSLALRHYQVGAS